MREQLRRRHIGFSTLELVAGLTIFMILAAMAVIQMQGALPGIQVNAGLNQLVAQMRTARETAIAQRRNYQIFFTAPNQIQLRRLEVPAGFTNLPALPTPGPGQFTLYNGLPDTPDGFGNATAISFGGTPTLTFLSDGTFVDSRGVPLNGTVFIGLPPQPETARAVTILGTTGRVSAYHWTGTAWEE